MTQALGFILLIAALVVHEAGHAIAMSRRDIEIEEASIFIPVGKVRLTFRPKFLSYPLVIGIIPLGAYVKTTPKGQQQLEAMNYKEQAICYSAGVITNLVFGCFLISAAFGFGYLMDGSGLTVTVVSLGIGVIVLVLRRFISVVMPILGIASLILIVALMVQSVDNMGGPIAIVGFVADQSTSLINALVIGGIISASLGQFNMVPLYPLDGAKVVHTLFVRWGWKKFGEYFRVGTMMIFLAFFVFIIVHDLL
ncbi:MAG: site-2 protease family protein [Candidatus Saccharimonadaceae bacterium]